MWRGSETDGAGGALCLLWLYLLWLYLLWLYLLWLHVAWLYLLWLLEQAGRSARLAAAGRTDEAIYLLALSLSLSPSLTLTLTLTLIPTLT